MMASTFSSCSIFRIISILLVDVTLLTLLQASFLPQTTVYPAEPNSSSVGYKEPCKEISTQKEEQYIFDIERHKCVSYYDSDCPINKDLQAIPDNDTYGFCDCVQNQPTVYNATTNSCYLLYQQSYFPTGEWLIYNDQSEANCVQNNCEFLRTSKYDIIALHRGKCVKIGEPNPDCGGDDSILVFQNRDAEPSCTFHRQLSIGGFVPPLRCSARTKWSSLTGRCQREFKITFS